MAGSSTIRTFIAVAVDCPIPLARVIKQLEQLGPALKTVSPRALHCTLKFLSETPPETAAALGVALQDAFGEAKMFHVKLSGVGAFPHAQRPTVIWAGFAEPQSELADLRARVEATAAGFGFASESRPFHPHVTLARVKRRPPPDLQRLLDEHATTEFGEVPVNSVELLKSTLTPAGPKYEVLATAALKR